MRRTAVTLAVFLLASPGCWCGFNVWRGDFPRDTPSISTQLLLELSDVIDDPAEIDNADCLCEEDKPAVLAAIREIPFPVSGRETYFNSHGCDPYTAGFTVNEVDARGNRVVQGESGAKYLYFVFDDGPACWRLTHAGTEKP